MKRTHLHALSTLTTSHNIETTSLLLSTSLLQCECIYDVVLLQQLVGMQQRLGESQQPVKGWLPSFPSTTVMIMRGFIAVAVTLHVCVFIFWTTAESYFVIHFEKPDIC